MQRWRILNGNSQQHCMELLEKWQTFADIVTVAPEQLDCIPAMLPDFDVYLATFGVKLTADDIAKAASRLKMVATPTTGSDHLPVVEIKRHGIRFYTLRESPALLDKVSSTAELCWGLLLALARHIVPASQDVLAGKWRRELFRGTQLTEKTLGIIGYGRLGRIVGRYGKAFGMKVLANDIRNDITADDGITLCPLEELLAQSDVVTIHIHLDEANRGFFNEKLFAQMKKGAILLNTSRGGILDEKALLAALESGRLAAAGLDVLENEWEGDLASSPLVKFATEHDNLLITPHCGGASLDAQKMTFAEMLRNVHLFMREHDAAPEVEAL